MSWCLQLHPRGCFIELTSGCSQLMVLITSLLVKSWEISRFKSMLHIPSSGKSNASVCSQEKGGFNFPRSCVFFWGVGGGGSEVGLFFWFCFLKTADLLSGFTFPNCCFLYLSHGVVVFFLHLILLVPASFSSSEYSLLWEVISWKRS